MNYKIVVQDSAIADALEYAAYILQESQSPEAAKRWLDDLEALINGLEKMPKRYGAIPEQGAFKLSLRQVNYHSHRVVYHVDDQTQTVHVLRVYPGSRRSLSPSEIPSLGAS